MKLFSEHAKVLFQSQWGEDGIIQAIFDRIGTTNMHCVEFGAADGLFCSNTAHLWGNCEWQGYLYESDTKLYAKMVDELALKIETGSVICGNLTIHHLDPVIEYPVDLVSMDIDGHEYGVLQDMKVRHRVLVIEHNPTVPPHMEMVGGEGVGSSALSLVKLAESKGYRFLTATLTNLFFVVEEEFDVFEREGYSFSLKDNFDYSSVNYIVTDYTGGYALKGLFPYGLSNPVHIKTKNDIPTSLLPYIARQSESFSDWAMSRFKEFPKTSDEDDSWVVGMSNPPVKSMTGDKS